MSRKKEIWRPVPIPPWDELFEVSNHGRVRHAPRILPTRLIEGYPTISVQYRGQQRDVAVHRWVASAFIRPPKSGECVNHKDFDRQNNYDKNLEWTTLRGNVAHAKAAGRYLEPMRWPRHPLAKIDVKIAFDMKKCGHSLRTIANRFGVSKTAVSALLKRARERGEI